MMGAPSTTNRLLSRPSKRRARPPARIAADISSRLMPVIMPEARIGRLLAASLHQAIVEVLPDRLDFYEYWLGGEGVRDNHFDLAQTVAVFGFLRTEGEAYDRVMARAAEWSRSDVPALKRLLIGRLPRAIRARAALGESARVVRAICSVSRAK